MDLSGRIKRGFITGLALVAPLFITIVAFQLVFSWLRGLIDPIVAGTRLSEFTGGIPYVAEFLALLLIGLAVAVLGYIAQRSIGAYVFELVDRGLGLVPVFSVVYTGIRQVSDALMSQQSRFDRVVMVEYPRPGLYALGFVTADSPVEVSDGTGERTQNVYLPNSPNPTNGHLALVPESEIVSVDLSVSRAIRLMVTTGIAESQEEIEELQSQAGGEAVDPAAVLESDGDG